MASPSGRRRPCRHAEVGVSPAPLQGPVARVAPAAAWTGRGSCFGRGSGTDPAWQSQACPPQARAAVPPHPLSQAERAGPRPGGWLCTARPKERRPPAEPRWPPPPPTGHADVCARNQGAFPPACLETFAIHPAAGADRVWHGDGGCGQNGADFVGKGRDCWGGEAGLCTGVEFGTKFGDSLLLRASPEKVNCPLHPPASLRRHPRSQRLLTRTSLNF